MYYIYHPTTYKQYFPKHSMYGPGVYETEQAAKAQRTKAINAGKLTADWQVISTEAFRANEPMVETRNILNPEAGPIMIRISEKGGCTDPGTERYHTM